MTNTHKFTRVDFERFKAFSKFTLHIQHFNILVGPNNSGKSTILAAFRILAAAMRRANSRRSEIVPGPGGSARGYPVDLSSIAVAEENIFFNYNDDEPALVTFTLSNKNKLTLYFPSVGTCYLIADSSGPLPQTPTAFRSKFNCPIGFVPILGPVEHNELLYGAEAARLALFNYRAARNFRNIWHHYPDKFDEFRNLLRQTWPGMDVDPPTIETSHDKPRLYMFCPEERIPREIFWAGFGFQVWCQMLTHLIQSKENALFMIDEPDIYLHSDLQRQLFGILKNLGPDIIIATHSTEIISEADAEDIVVINKKRTNARRIKDASQLVDVFTALGSNINPILTQLAKTKRAVFVEGNDFQLIAKFARKLGCPDVGNRNNFAVVPAKGFNPERIRSLKAGMEFTLGTQIRAAAIFDRDYRSDGECEQIARECASFCEYVCIHKQKEIENFLQVPEAIDRAVLRKINERRKRTGEESRFDKNALDVLSQFSKEKRIYVTSQFQESARQFEHKQGNKVHGATINEKVAENLEIYWSNPRLSFSLVPGKEALSQVSRFFQEKYKVSITGSAIIEAIRVEEILEEMNALVQGIAVFSSK